ncbi:hypothetical protein Y032_0216g2376 [Ancylostoma ceylanicum]|uniref:G-protein coupled receptors family 1 profile domain-containing protein n=1 Tax=Ancylostoma ceylanicum TaxID=53326 RepID=A0A016SJ73_9BILA|nr:hypothetical protein Y032_0216g2376 [Ancylostoma ceylanicum]
MLSLQAFGLLADRAMLFKNFVNHCKEYCSYEEPMQNNLSFIITDIVILFLQLTGIVCNGFILFMFFRVKKLYRNEALRLVLYLAITDFLHAITTLPYIIYLVVFWNPYSINLDPYFIMISSTPLIIQLKINLTLTIAIALERTMALFTPVLYRKLSSSLYATASLLLGMAFACGDLALEFALSPFVEQPNCAAIGCYVSDKFRYYWGISNMVFGLFVIVLTVMILLKLRSIHNHSKSARILVNKDAGRFRQANRTSVGILSTSLLFVTLPSVGVGFVEMIGFSIFKTVGPFYIVGLLSAGACNSIVYVVLNKDLRALAKSCITGGGLSTSTSATTRVSMSRFQSTMNK